MQANMAVRLKVDYLEEYPELVVMWAGYAFSKEYNQGRGHGHAIEDIRNILRTGDNENSPNACNLLDLQKHRRTKSYE